MHSLILDVYPINLNKPLRIEFTKEEKILHIKSFDIQSQRTTGKQFLKVKILPANEFIFDDQDLDKWNLAYKLI